MENTVKPACQAADQCGYTTILWTADTVDWEDPAPSHDTLVQRVTGDKLCSGAILLMHPKGAYCGSAARYHQHHTGQGISVCEGV